MGKGGGGIREYGSGVGFVRPEFPPATSASSCPAGRTMRFRPRSSRGAGTAWSTRQFERYISVSKVLSAADEQGLNRHPSTSGECSGSVVAIATKREARTMLVDLRLRLSGRRTGPR